MLKDLITRMQAKVQACTAEDVYTGNPADKGLVDVVKGRLRALLCIFSTEGDAEGKLSKYIEEVGEALAVEHCTRSQEDIET